MPRSPTPGKLIYSRLANILVLFSTPSKVSTFPTRFRGSIPSACAFGLLPCCLRLTLQVTRQCPRLAMSDLLNLSQWDSHPLYGAPLRGARTVLFASREHRLFFQINFMDNTVANSYKICNLSVA